MIAGTQQGGADKLCARPWNLVVRFPLRRVGSVAGVAVILLAVASGLSPKRPFEVLTWLQEAFGWAFAVPYAFLIALGAYAVMRVIECPDSRFARELGLQTASGMATLALTFTLLGISLGIGSLTGAALTPENVQEVVADLTAHFSLAFMTTVVGLPSAALLRAAIVLCAVRETKPGVNVVTARRTT